MNISLVGIKAVAACAIVHDELNGNCAAQNFFPLEHKAAYLS